VHLKSSVREKIGDGRYFYEFWKLGNWKNFFFIIIIIFFKFCIICLFYYLFILFFKKNFVIL